MGNIFLVYDSYGNIQTAADTYPNVTPPSQLLVLNDTDTNAQAALAQPQNYMVQSGKVISAVTIGIDRTYTINGAWNTYTLALNTSDKSVHTVTISFLGQNLTVTTDATGSASLIVALHTSLQNTNVPITASGSGLISHDTFIGGSGISSTPLQAYKDANGQYHVAPTSKSFLSNYWTSQAVNTAYSAADTGTLFSMLLQTVYGMILPKLTAGSTPILTLDANQQNAVTDITNNLLPNLLTTLENAAPVPTTGKPQTYDLHYSHAVATFASTKTAMDNYVADLQNIPNLV